MWRGLGSMNKGPNATICLVRRQNHAGTTVSWTTVQREKSSHAYKLSSNGVTLKCVKDSFSRKGLLFAKRSFIFAKRTFIIAKTIY